MSSPTNGRTIIDAESLPIEIRTHLNFIVKEITGCDDATDTTIFHWQRGSICSTSPVRPQHLRSPEEFRILKCIKPESRFSGKSYLNRQGGEVKSIEFVPDNLASS